MDGRSRPHSQGGADEGGASGTVSKVKCATIQGKVRKNPSKVKCAAMSKAKCATTQGKVRNDVQVNVRNDVRSGNRPGGLALRLSDSRGTKVRG